MKTKEINGVREIFRLGKIKETVEDKFVKGQIDEVIDHIEGTIDREDILTKTESGEVFSDRRMFLHFNNAKTRKKLNLKLEHRSPTKLIVIRGKTNPYFHEDYSLTDYHKGTIKREFEEHKQLCVA